MSNFQPLESGSSGSKHPPKSVKTNVEVQNTNNFLIFHMCKVPCIVVEFVLLVCWKRYKEIKVGDFGVLAVVCDVHCVLSLVLV